MGEVRKTEFFTVENFKALNGEGYRNSDVRTYTMPPLADTPYEDILIHLSLPDKGSHTSTLIRTNKGNFSGNQYSETFDKAAKLILHFPKASEIKTPKGLVQIDRKKLPNLYPSWMITRYGNLSAGQQVQHETPLYLDKGTKEFLYFFDESFLDELDPALLTDGVDNQVFRVYRNDKNRRFLALRSKEFWSFERMDLFPTPGNHVAKAWLQIQHNYKRFTLDSRDLEKVIVIQYLREHSQTLTEQHRDVPLMNSSLQLTFGLAARHEQTYYWMDENDEINTQVADHVSRGHNHSPLGLLRGGETYQDSGATVVIPYTEADWDRLSVIKAQLDAVQSSLWELISGCKGEKGSKMDHSLGESLQRMDSAKLLGFDSNE